MHNEDMKTNNFTFTNHALVRMQQRVIPMEAIYFVAHNGLCHKTHGLQKRYINKKAWNNKIKKLDTSFIKKNEKHILSIAVVRNDDSIITVMHKNKKVRWN